MAELVVKLLISALLTVLIKAGVALLGHSVAWWLAALIALVVVFGGWFVIVDSDDGWWH
jgi:hypothetical protein